MLRSLLERRLPEPTSEYRRRAWVAFQAALDRQFARRQENRPPMQMQR